MNSNITSHKSLHKVTAKFAKNLIQKWPFFTGLIGGTTHEGYISAAVLFPNAPDEDASTLAVIELALINNEETDPAQILTNWHKELIALAESCKV